MNERYEKPRMKMVSLRDNRAVADVCWGNHSESTQRYFDTDGKGYIGYYISGGSCNLTNSDGTEYYLTVNYYDHKGDTEAEKLNPDDERYKFMYDKLLKMGGNAGQPFKGEADTFPDNPGGMS